MKDYNKLELICILLAPILAIVLSLYAALRISVEDIFVTYSIFIAAMLVLSCISGAWYRIEKEEVKI